jgi:hypothetical protein
VRAEPRALLLERPLEEVETVPAGDEVERGVVEQGAQALGLPRELVPELDSGVAGRARFREALLQRDVTAQVVEVVVAPDDRIHSDAHRRAHRAPR